MPIRDLREGEEYAPTEGEIGILKKLKVSVDAGLSYGEMKKKTGLSDTALSKFLSRMQEHNLVIRGQKRRYHVTIIGLMFLKSLNPVMISGDELKGQKRRDLERLWDQVHALQKKVLLIAWLPYADETSKLMAIGGSGLGPDLVLIGALKSHDGEQILRIESPGLRTLQELGYLDVHE